MASGRQCSRLLSSCSKNLLATSNSGLARLQPCSTAASNIVQSPIPDVPVFDSGNYTVNLFRSSHKWQDKVALECSTSRATTTYAQLRDQIARWGGYMARLGLGKGDVVAVVAPNLNEYAPIAYGTAAVGGIITGINPTYTADEISFQLSDSNTKLVVVFGPMEPVVKQALAMGGLHKVPIVSVGPDTGSGLPQAKDILNDSAIAFAEPAEVDGKDVLALLYSSGTTGKPKGAMISHDGAFSNLCMVTHESFLANYEGKYDIDNRFLQLLPMYHAGGMLGVNAVGLQCGARMVNYAKFDPASFLKVIQEFKISEMPVVPAVLTFMAAHPACNSTVMKSLRCILCGTAPLSPTVLDVLLKKIDRPVDFQQAYGMTELLFATMDRHGHVRPGCTGQLVPGVKAKVIDLTDGVTALPAGQNGELWIKSDSTMLGYLNKPEETAATIDADGWLHTGDVGSYDQDGYFKIVDRTKELIKVKGLQVSPSEVEDVLLQIPGVVEASVVGVPHPRLGEAPRAYLVTRKPIEAAEVSKFLSSKLAPYKQLEGGIEFVKSLPRTSTGKVIKKELQQMALEGR